MMAESTDYESHRAFLCPDRPAEMLRAAAAVHGAQALTEALKRLDGVLLQQLEGFVGKLV